MGKRKHKDKDSYYRRKYKRLQERFRRDYSSDEADRDGYRSPSVWSGSPSDDERIYRSDSEVSISDPQNNNALRSVIRDIAAPSGDDMNSSRENNIASTSAAEPRPGPSGLLDDTGSKTLPAEILEALGDPKAKGEVFGPKILDEISERWGRILVDGLTKEQKADIHEKTLIPDNYRLAKAPLLNQEVSGILGEAVKNRDKLLEKSQNYLGLGVAALTSLTSSLIEKDMDKLEIIKKISEISQIFLDLHSENTKTRRKLVMASLDRNFNASISDVKRDKFLFGENLWERIRAVRTAEKTGHQIRRSDNANQRKYSAQENWRGPPRQYSQRSSRQGGQRSRYQQYQYQPYRRAAPPLPAARASASERLPPPPPYYPNRGAPPPPLMLPARARRIQ